MNEGGKTIMSVKTYSTEPSAITVEHLSLVFTTFVRCHVFPPRVVLFLKRSGFTVVTTPSRDNEME